jgi:RNA polymerase sigma-70 factor (ECF subfamily)
MGVFHMAIPFPSAAGSMSERGSRLPSKLKQPSQRERQLPATEPAANRLPHGTLAQKTGEGTEGVADGERGRAASPGLDAERAAMLLLVQRCRTGEQRAWQELVQSQHRRVYGLCYRFTGDASEAEDVTQDVFLKIYRNLASFDTEKGTLQTWITTLTRNLLVDTYRRAKMERATDSLDVTFSKEEDGPTRAERLPDTRPGINQERHVAGLELKARIQHALKKLSPELREAVILRDLEDMDYKDIAQVLKIPEGTVKSRISRGRAELARLLQSLEGQVM